MVGRFYDSSGSPTPLLQRVEAAAAAAAAAKAAAEAAKAAAGEPADPACDVKWSQLDGEACACLDRCWRWHRPQQRVQLGLRWAALPAGTIG